MICRSLKSEIALLGLFLNKQYSGITAVKFLSQIMHWKFIPDANFLIFFFLQPLP